MNLQQIDKQLQKKVSRERRFYLVQEIPKGEALLKRVQENSPHWSKVVRALTKMYLLLNCQVGELCELLNYPPNQVDWDNSQPLKILGKLYKGIETTEWYQMQLGAMLQPTNHPWFRIITPSMIKDT